MLKLSIDTKELGDRLLKAIEEKQDKITSQFKRPLESNDLKPLQSRSLSRIDLYRAIASLRN